MVIFHYKKEKRKRLLLRQAGKAQELNSYYVSCLVKKESLNT